MDEKPYEILAELPDDHKLKLENAQLKMQLAEAHLQLTQVAYHATANDSANKVEIPDGYQFVGVNANAKAVLRRVDDPQEEDDN